MASQEQLRRPEEAKDNLTNSDNVRSGIHESSDISLQDMASSAFARAIPTYNERAPPSQKNKDPSHLYGLRTDDILAPSPDQHPKPAISDPSRGLYQGPGPRDTIFVGKSALPGTGLAHKAYDAGVIPAEGANERPNVLQPTAAKSVKLSSRIIDAQGYTVPSPAEVQNEPLTASGTTRSDFPPVTEELFRMKLCPTLFERVEEKQLDLMIRFGNRDIPFGGRIPIEQTLEKPQLYLRKQEIVRPDDVYLLVLVDVDLQSFQRLGTESSLFLQWMIQDVRIPASNPEVDVVNRVGREMVEYSAGSRSGDTQGHVLMLYRQDKPLPSSLATKIQREGFHPKEFISSQELELPHPVLVFYYETQ